MWYFLFRVLVANIYRYDFVGTSFNFDFLNHFIEFLVQTSIKVVRKCWVRGRVRIMLTSRIRNGEELESIRKNNRKYRAIENRAAHNNVKFLSRKWTNLLTNRKTNDLEFYSISWIHKKIILYKAKFVETIHDSQQTHWLVRIIHFYKIRQYRQADDGKEKFSIFKKKPTFLPWLAYFSHKHCLPGSCDDNYCSFWIFYNNLEEKNSQLLAVTFNWPLIYDSTSWNDVWARVWRNTNGLITPTLTRCLKFSNM